MEILVEQARRAPDAPLYLGDDPKTYADVAADARRFAAFLLDRGVGPGQTVVAPLVGGWEATVVLAATSNVGAGLLRCRAVPHGHRCSGLVDATEAAVWRSPDAYWAKASGRTR